MNTYLKLLYDEHSVIMNAIELAKDAESLIGKDDVLYEKTIRNLIDFFRNYADKYHHNKEEMILFPEMNKKNEFLQDGVIKEMFDNHEDFREMIRNIEKKLDAKNFIETQKELNAYGEALSDHIAVENEEVFQMAESIFDDDELEKINFRFLDSDRELGDKRKEELKEHISGIKA
jgi:hemerythrin-like domain-containing protein